MLIPLITPRSSQRYLRFLINNCFFFKSRVLLNLQQREGKKNKERNVHFFFFFFLSMHQLCRKLCGSNLKLSPLQRCQIDSTMIIQITFCLSPYLILFFFFFSWSTPVPAIVCGSLPADTKSNTCSPY